MKKGAWISMCIKVSRNLLFFFIFISIVPTILGMDTLDYPNNSSISYEGPLHLEQFSQSFISQSIIPDIQGQNSSINGLETISNESVGLLTPGIWNYRGGLIIGDVSILGPRISGDPTRIFARGTDSALWCYTYPSGPWTRLGGLITSSPTAGYDKNGKTHVMVRGGDGAIWDNIDGGWYSLGGFIKAESPDVRFSWNPSDTNYFLISVRGGDNALWLRRMNINDRSGSWQNLGGSITSAPSVLSDPNVANTIRIVVKGADNALWVRSLNTVDNSGSWRSLGGCLLSEPVAMFETYGYRYPVTIGTRTYYMYAALMTAAIGCDNALWLNIYDIDANWAGWWGLGGSIASKPSIVRPYQEHWEFKYDPYGNFIGASITEPRDIAAKGSDNSLWDIEIAGTRSTYIGPEFELSSPWTSLGGYITNNPIFGTPKWIGVRGGEGALWTYNS